MANAAIAGIDLEDISHITNSIEGQNHTPVIPIVTAGELPDNSTRPTNPIISRERALEIGGEYIGSRPVIALPPSIEWAHGRWVWVIWLSHEHNGWETNVLQIDTNSGEVLGHVYGRGNEFYRTVTANGSVSSTQVPNTREEDLYGVWESTIDSSVMEFNQDGSLVTTANGFRMTGGAWSISENLITITATVTVFGVTSTGTGTGRFEVSADCLRLFNQDGSYNHFVRVG